MTKVNAPARKSTSRSAKKRSGKDGRVIAVMPDGVKILSPKTKPDHFTNSEIRKTIERLRRDGVIMPLSATADE